MADRGREVGRRGSERERCGKVEGKQTEKTERMREHSELGEDKHLGSFRAVT